ncbi:MAG: tetratricopeptide repeat protein [Bryobacteraceae bacterium]
MAWGLWLGILCALAAVAQEGQKEQIPPEEDERIAVTEYSFNPLQASKELQIGNFYFRKGSFRAAALRFREATKWNPGFGEAWRRLGEAEEKRKDFKAAKAAYEKFVELEPDSKEAEQIRKKLKISARKK